MSEDQNAGGEAGPDAATIERAILRLCERRGDGRSVCPSEVARELDPAHWRQYMQAVRDAAARLQQAGRLDVLQRGQRVDAAGARGPLRLRRRGDG